MEHPCSSPTFRPHPCGLSWQPHSVQRCEMPAPERHQPAGQLPCTLLEKNGGVFTATQAPCLRPLRLLCCRGLFAALRRKRCARSLSQGCDRQFGEARMAVHERSVRHDVAAEGTAKRREEGPAAEEVQWPAPTAHTHKTKAAVLKKRRPLLTSITTRVALFYFLARSATYLLVSSSGKLFTRSSIAFI